MTNLFQAFDQSGNNNVNKSDILLTALNRTVTSLDPYLLGGENNVPISKRQIIVVLTLTKLWIFL